VPPLDAQAIEWDAVIVGTGIGGATLGLVLAEAGRRVIFVEKGRDLASDALRGQAPESAIDYGRVSRAEQRELLARAGRAHEELFDVARGRSVLPEIGCGSGGSSSLYGMVLERFFPADFAAWPVSYQELRPWYEAAERLYRVRGGADPLRPHEAAALLPPAPASAGAQQLVEQLQARGLHPYRLHLACESVEGCSVCQGYLCPRECKNDADRIALRPALGHGARLLSDCAAITLEAGRTRVAAVHCESTGHATTLRGRVVVLAAGALGTPALLLSSRSAVWPSGLANGSGLVGRNLMRHAIDLWALGRAPRLQLPADAKAIGFNDLYDRDAGKFGSVQSFGRLPPLRYVLNQRPRTWRLAAPLAGLLWRRFADVPILAAILEDRPLAANGIEPEGAGSPARWRVSYRAGASEHERRARFRRELRRRLRGLGALLVSGEDAPKALGHVCGTCRFGNDPRTSVLDRHNRSHELDNLYVVDASFFPSSAGINPALTIAANALRVGAELLSRLA
jgi:choline dehydrogenase-like flavoprotein